MKVVLSYLCPEDNKDVLQQYLPYGVLTLASYLNAEVVNIENRAVSEGVEEVAALNPDIVGVSCFSFNRFQVFEFARLIKKKMPNVKVIAGGPFTSALPHEILHNIPSIDFVVIGEGEKTFAELIEFLSNNQDNEQEKLKNIKGIAFRNSNSVILTGKRNFIESLDKIPLPSERFFYNYILTTRGCPGQCIYCQSPDLWECKLRFRDHKKVADEIEQLHNKYGITNFKIWDDTFFVKKDFVISFCKEIINRNLKIMWDCSARVNLVNDEVIEWAKKAGCYAVYLGVESGSKKILNNIKKYIDIEQIKNAFQTIRKFGLETHMFLMIGNPGEDDSTIEETASIIKEVVPGEVIISKLKIEPGTQLFRKCCKEGFIKAEDYFDKNKEKDDFHYTKEVNEEKLNEWLDKLSQAFIEVRQKYIPSIESVEELIKKYGTAYDYFVLGSISRDKEKAMSAFLKAVSVNQGFVPIYNLLGSFYAQEGKIEKAISYFKEAVKKDPWNPLAKINLGIAFSSIGKFKEAIDMYHKAIKVAPARKEELLARIKELNKAVH